MTFEIRQRTAEEIEAYRRVSEIAFGETPSTDPASLASYEARHEIDREFGAYEGKRIVGAAGAYSVQMTVPGGGSIPTAAVTDITVLPTHRRLGIATALVRDQLERVRDRGETAAALWASESIIYGRWGYGMAIQHEMAAIDTRHTRFAYQPQASGRIRFVDADEAMSIFPGIWERARPQWPGFMTRKTSFWERNIRDIDHSKTTGEGGPFFAVYAESGSDDGFVMYRTRYGVADDTGHDEQDDGRTVAVEQLLPTTAAAHAALWRYCFDIDLFWRASFEMMPVDDPLWWMLEDPRRLKRIPYDAIWLRLVDVPAALSNRRYASTGRLVIEVDDEFCPWAGGRFELDSSEDGAGCKPTRKAPDLSMSAADLAAAYLGGTRFTPMARAARVEERSGGSLQRADAMFAADRAPWCPMGF